MSVTPPGRRSSSPRWCAGRSAAARAAIVVERHVELQRDRRRRQDVGQVAEPEQRRLEVARRPPACARRAAVPSSPRILDAVRRDVRRRVDAERHDASGERARRAAITRGSSALATSTSSARACSRISALASAIASADAKKPEVRVADVGPDADLRLGDADERADLARMIHAELDDRDVRSRPQLEQRQRQADVVVQVALVPEHPVPRRQELRRDFLRRRLARRCR